MKRVSANSTSVVRKKWNFISIILELLYIGDSPVISPPLFHSVIEISMLTYYTSPSACSSFFVSIEEYHIARSSTSRPLSPKPFDRRNASFHVKNGSFTLPIRILPRNVNIVVPCFLPEFMRFVRKQVTNDIFNEPHFLPISFEYSHWPIILEFSIPDLRLWNSTILDSSLLLLPMCTVLKAYLSILRRSMRNYHHGSMAL